LRYANSAFVRKFGTICPYDFPKSHRNRFRFPLLEESPERSQYKTPPHLACSESARYRGCGTSGSGPRRWAQKMRNSTKMSVNGVGRPESLVLVGKPTTLYTVSQLKRGQNSNPFKYNTTRHKHISL